MQPYFFLALAAPVFAVWFGWRVLQYGAARRQVPARLAQGATVIDVRTPAEFAAGSRPGSLNIPLAQLEKRADRLDRHKPVILCCATGARSASATAILKGKGFSQVVNAGPWTNTLA